MAFPQKSNQNKPSSKGMPMVESKNTAKSGKLPKGMPKPVVGYGKKGGGK